MDMLREARSRAGISQRELARRAGTSQAMVARIETGAQSPGVATLERLMRACDASLVLEAGAGPSPEPSAAGPLPAEVLVWSLGADRYAFPLPVVGEVVAAPRLRRLPGQPDGYGVVATREGLLPAVDAAVVLGAEPPPSRRLITVSTASGLAGVLVGEAHGIASISPTPPPSRAGVSAAVRATALAGDVIVVVLDPDLLCYPHARATHRT